MKWGPWLVDLTLILGDVVLIIVSSIQTTRILVCLFPGRRHRPKKTSAWGSRINYILFPRITPPPGQWSGCDMSCFSFVVAEWICERYTNSVTAATHTKWLRGSLWLAARKFHEGVRMLLSTLSGSKAGMVSKRSEARPGGWRSKPLNT